MATVPAETTAKHPMGMESKKALLGLNDIAGCSTSLAVKLAFLVEETRLELSAQLPKAGKGTGEAVLIAQEEDDEGGEQEVPLRQRREEREE